MITPLQDVRPETDIKVSRRASLPRDRMTVALCYSCVAAGIVLAALCFCITGHIFDENAFASVGDRVYSLHQNPVFYWQFSSLYLAILLFFQSTQYAAMTLGIHFTGLNLFAIKLPLIAGYALTVSGSIWLGRLIGVERRRLSLIGALVAGSYLTLFISFVHGMFDVLVSASVVYALAFFIARKWGLGSCALGAAAALKLAGLALIPIACIYTFRTTRSLRKTLYVAIVPVAMTVVAYLPIVFQRAQAEHAIRGVVDFTVRPSGAFSPFSVWAYFVAVFPHLLNMVSPTLFVALYVAAGTLIVVVFWRATRSLNRDIALLCASSAILYLLLCLNPVNFPQYALWALPIAVVLGVAQDSRLIVLLSLLGVVTVVGLAKVAGLYTYLAVTLSRVGSTPFDGLLAIDQAHAFWFAGLLSILEALIALCCLWRLMKPGKICGSGITVGAAVTFVTSLGTLFYVALAIAGSGGFVPGDHLHFANADYEFVTRPSPVEGHRNTVSVHLEGLASTSGPALASTEECVYFSQRNAPSAVFINGHPTSLINRSYDPQTLTVDADKTPLAVTSSGCASDGAVRDSVQTIMVPGAFTPVAVATHIDRTSLRQWWESNKVLICALGLLSCLMVAAVVAVTALSVHHMLRTAT